MVEKKLLIWHEVSHIYIYFFFVLSQHRKRKNVEGHWNKLSRVTKFVLLQIHMPLKYEFTYKCTHLCLMFCRLKVLQSFIKFISTYIYIYIFIWIFLILRQLVIENFYEEQKRKIKSYKTIKIVFKTFVKRNSSRVKLSFNWNLSMGFDHTIKVY